MTVNAYTVSKAFVFYNDCKSIVKMYYLNDVPFTFDELPDGHLWDKDLVEEATKNMPLDVEDVYKGSNYLISEQCHPMFDNIKIINLDTITKIKLLVIIRHLLMLFSYLVYLQEQKLYRRVP